VETFSGKNAKSAAGGVSGQDFFEGLQAPFRCLFACTISHGISSQNLLEAIEAHIVWIKIVGHDFPVQSIVLVPTFRQFMRGGLIFGSLSRRLRFILLWLFWRL